MTSNRLLYDECAYSKRIKESTSPVGYLLNPIKFENCNKCRNELGLLGGTNVSINNSNLVDVESDLSGRTRLLSQCPQQKHQPGNCKCVHDSGIPGDCDSCQPQKRHLRPCNMFQYKPRPTDVGYRLPEMKCAPNQSNNLNKNVVQKPAKNRMYVPSEWQGQQGERVPVSNPSEGRRVARQFVYY